MTFGREKRLLLGGLALAAPIPLPFTGILGWPFLLAYVGVVLAFFRRARRDPGAWLPTWAMNVLALAYLPYFAFDLMVLSRARLIAAVTHLLLFTVLVKLFALRRERDKWQTVIAIFFLFLASMATATHPTLALYLIGFLGLSLLLFTRFAQLHLAAGFTTTEGERQALLAVPVGRFLAVATLATLVLAVPLFAALPRVRSPFIPGQGRGMGALGAVSGFSDQVTLDTIGSIRTSREVAMRLRYEGDPPPGHEMRFKGGAFDFYRDGVWRPLPGLPRNDLPPSMPGSGQLRLAAPPARHWVDVYLRPIAGQALLVPAEGVVIENDGSALYVNEAGVVRRSRGVMDVQEYRVGMADQPASKARPVDPGSGLAEIVLDTEGVSPAIAQLAAEVAGTGPPRLQAQRLETFLTAEFEYTLDLVGAPRSADPLETFLFETRRGHCEYFATAMVLMLRSVGIPARLATGYLGGEYNPLEGYMIVRQANAHAWVEAYLPESGWTDFDPTPAAGRPLTEMAGFAAIASQAWDYLLFRWDRYVLTYGMGDQVRALVLARSLWERVKGLFGARDGEPDGAPAEPVAVGVDNDPVPVDAPAFPLSPLWILAMAVAIGLAAALAARRWRRPLDGIAAYYRLRRTAARNGLPQHPAEAPLGFAAALARRFPAAAAASGEVIGLYLRQSFGGEELGATERATLRTALGQARRAIKKTG